MSRLRALWVLGFLAASCGGSSGDQETTGAAGNDTTGGAGGVAGSGGASGGSGTAGAAGAAGNTGAGAGGTSAPDSGGAGSVGAGGVDAGGPDARDASGGMTDGGQSFLPAGYKGTPFAALQIPGRINAADYDRGGAGVAWCHDMNNCGAGTVTGDWYPAGSPPYRSPIPATASICGGAACADNVGICRMSPNKPDHLITGQPAPPNDTYLCYSVAGEWTKYTVVVAEAGTYSVGGFMAVPSGGGVNLSFGGNITTGNLMLAITPTTNCGSGENYHCWDQRDNLATVTFPAAGTYLMTMTQVGRFNADNFTFTKM
jgi:hypothetical protein